MRESLAKKLAMRRIVEPSRRATRMRKRDVRHAVSRALTTDRVIKRDPSPETIDRETAEEKDHSRS
jgi:hypothetical protein